MFIVWGRKITRRTLGYVADFCGVCRVPRAFRMTRLGSVGHVYYISFGEGNLVGHERACTSCGAFSEADVNAYAGISKSSGSLESLKRETFPGLDAALEQRLALEVRVQTAPHLLSAEERMGLIFSPFNLLSPKVERHFATMRMDGGVALAIAGGIGLCFLVPAIGGAISPEYGPPGFLLGLVAGFGLLIWQLLAAGGRFMRKEIVPLLAQSLSPVKPNEAEIERALGEFKRAGHKIGKKLKAAQVIEAIRSPR
ncbi:hypothetical protein [Duganella sp. Root1480D1]|uniref:hypothetical protein n=1 Tax=Duganella sp. Root1480D1 TaxID=1736471 RepID=UPI00070B4F71|nr:hypothetical protein [Duganella sp. Root1480D1]KQZ34174.1 hypothetical protein ASD58_28830 [Duganella sp. Root1480D1]